MSTSTRIRRPRLSPIVAVGLCLVLAACVTLGESPRDGAGIPETPLPSYAAGDSFAYRDAAGKTYVRRVTAVDGERVDWEIEEGYRFASLRNFALPNLAWDGDSSRGALVGGLDDPGLLWPLAHRNEARLTVAYEKRDKDDGGLRRYDETWGCRVNRPREISVPAGRFDTHKIVCKRFDDDGTVTRTHIWYYAPAVGHFVKRIKKYRSGRRQEIELVSVTRGVAS